MKRRGHHAAWRCIEKACQKVERLLLGEVAGFPRGGAGYEPHVAAMLNEQGGERRISARACLNGT